MADLIKKAPFSPVITGAALYLLTKAPLSAREPALLRLRQLLSPEHIGYAITTLKWLFAYGLIRNINDYLNELANNNFKLFADKKQWVWSKEIAVVTGGSSGFGALFSQDLAAKGIHVCALDINEPPPHIASNPRITFFKCDVTSHQEVMDVAQRIQHTVGHPSILINNAGIASGHSMLDTSPQWVRKIFDVNLLSHYYTIQAFLPSMIEKKKGHVVNIASAASFIVGPGMVDYCATKAGALVLHQGLTAELRYIYKCPEINTTVVHPTWAGTNMVNKYKEQIEKSGDKVIDPQIISDAVVKQILSCRGNQLIITPLPGLVSTLRSYPTWFQHMLMSLRTIPEVPSN